MIAVNYRCSYWLVVLGGLGLTLGISALVLGVYDRGIIAIGGGLCLIHAAYEPVEE